VNRGYRHGAVGDAVAARFIVDRLTPRPRGLAIALDLPAGAGAPDEAVSVSRVLEGRLRATLV
jgi:hypothetical protein